MKKWSLVLLGILLAIAMGAYLYNKYRIAPNLSMSQLQLTDLNGTPVQLHTYADKNIFLNFFATWCGPCMAEIPALQKAIANLKSDDFVMILVSDEPVKRIQPLAEALEGEIIILRSEKKLSFYGVFTIPTTYILARQNRVVYHYVGVDDWASNEILSKIRELVK